MKSMIEVRKFAVEMAVAVMGQGTADKDVVGKAMEIEKYVVGNAVLPETYDEASIISGTLGNLIGTLTK